MGQPHALGDLGNALALSGDRAAAIKVYGQGLALNPEPQFRDLLYWNRGSALAEEGNRELAIVDFEAIVELSQDPRLVVEAGAQVRALLNNGP